MIYLSNYLLGVCPPGRRGVYDLSIYLLGVCPPGGCCGDVQDEEAAGGVPLRPQTGLPGVLTATEHQGQADYLSIYLSSLSIQNFISCS